MKNTNSRQFKEGAFSYLLDAIYDADHLITREERTRHLRAKFISEYFYRDNLRRYRSIQGCAQHWLEGMPLNIAAYNGDILETSAKMHELPAIPADKEPEVLKNWFPLMAFKMLQLFDDQGMPITLEDVKL